MTPESRRIAMAELEGRIGPYDIEDWPIIRDSEGNPILFYSSLDECQRVFKGLTEELKREVWRHVNVLTYAETGKTVLPFEATPAQWVESILRAMGRFTEDAECDHEWKEIDASFDHEFGVEQIYFQRCEKCDAERPVEPEGES